MIHDANKLKSYEYNAPWHGNRKQNFILKQKKKQECYFIPHQLNHIRTEMEEVTVESVKSNFFRVDRTNHIILISPKNTSFGAGEKN